MEKDILEQPSDDINSQVAAANNEGENLDLLQGSKFGKFKSVENLVNAYESLEKEFTKKSQLIKEMQKTNDSDNGVKDEVAVHATEDIKSELKTSPQTDWTEQIDNFFEKNQTAKNYSKDIALELVQNPNLKTAENGLELAFNSVLAKRYKPMEAMAGDENFLNDYIYNNEKVKNKILAEYLSGVTSNKIPPIVLNNAQSSLGFSKTEKVRTLKEAKDLLEKMILE